MPTNAADQKILDALHRVTSQIKNTEERLISELDNDPSEELLNAYLKMKENKLEIKSIYDMNE